MKENNKVAVFIDGENISAKYASRIVEEASNYGDVIIKRVFADWTNQAVSPWKEAVSKNSLKAEQQFNAVKGKNSSDIRLIIDAMTILFEKNIDVFCLASSDSDFTSLVQELRERGKVVVGFGRQQTVQEFVNAFSEFIYLDEKIAVEAKMPVEKSEQKVQEQPLLARKKMKALSEIIDRLIEENGKALYSQIGLEMRNKYSDFVPRNYGYKTMKPFMAALMKDKYQIKTEADGTSLYLVPLAKKK